MKSFIEILTESKMTPIAELSKKIYDKVRKMFPEAFWNVDYNETSDRTLFTFNIESNGNKWKTQNGTHEPYYTRFSIEMSKDDRYIGRMEITEYENASHQVGRILRDRDNQTPEKIEKMVMDYFIAIKKKSEI